jgi:hypothetical protein
MKKKNSRLFYCRLIDVNPHPSLLLRLKASMSLLYRQKKDKERGKGWSPLCQKTTAK